MKDSLFGPQSNFNTRASTTQKKRRGVRHDRRIAPRLPQAADSPIITVTVGPGLPVDEIHCLITEPATAVVSLTRIRTEWDLLNWGYVEVWQGALPPQSDGALVRYQIRARDRHTGKVTWADHGEVHSYLVGDSGPPAWAGPAIIYQIFPDRFSPGDGQSWNNTSGLGDIYGGTLRGIIDHLDYIANMGFTAIWFNPFFPDDTHHGYHATDYFTVNPRLGTIDDMRELVDKAHARGLRLILDFVANHWGSKHPTFQDALTNPDSPYHDWYTWEEWPDKYAMYYTVADLPKINVDNPGAREHLLRSVAFWLGDMDFDGLRLDHADGPSRDFWVEMRAVARSVRPDAWMVGELIRPADEQLVYQGLFDGLLDFLLVEALRRTFAHGTMNLTEFDAFLQRHEAYFPANFSRPSFLDNHDMDRFLFIVDGDKRKLKLAALCQFTLMGAPTVYNGTEVGVHQEQFIYAPGSQGMEECRQPMVWGDEQDAELRDYFWYLAHLRRAHPALWRGRRRTVHLDARAGTYAYVRVDGSDAVLVGFNMSQRPRQFSIVDGRTNISYSFDLPPLTGDIVIL